jgi:hypothetical protein
MQNLELPGWQILYDREATVAAHAKILTGGAESCGCDPCRNWANSRIRIIPVEFRDLLELLGIPLDREREVYHNCRLESGLHSYAGWYHFIGHVLTGEKEDAAPVAFGCFSIFFHSRPALLPTAFAGLARIPTAPFATKDLTLAAASFAGIIAVMSRRSVNIKCILPQCHRPPRRIEAI